MKYVVRLTMLVCFCLLLAQQAQAAGKTFTVLPFEVNAQGQGHLSKAVAATLTSRLASSGEASPVSKGADYVISGTVSVLGNDSTVHAVVRSKAGKEWSRDVQGPLSNLTASVNTLAAAIASEAMGLRARPASTAGAAPAGSPNGIVMNDDGKQPAEYYLNPQFRYQGGSQNDNSRLHSQKLPFGMVDMAVGDFNKDGKNEVAVLSDHKLYMFRMDGAKLTPLGETTVSMSDNCFSLRAIDLDKNGSKELIVVAYGEEDGRAASYTYSFAGGKFTQFCKKSDWFLSVVKLPPYYEDTVVGQAWDPARLMRPGVYIMKVSGGQYVKGSRIALPDGAKLFGINWMRPGSKENADKLLMFNDMERLKVYSAKNALLHTTDDAYSGSAAGIDYYKRMQGLNVNKSAEIADRYFAPMRIINFMDAQGDSIVLLNHPVSTASMIFSRYRYFPQGEIHAVYWDGVGLALKWKTRRIKGSVASIDMADVNNDGIADLVVGVNTSPSLGVGSRTSMVLAYPLDFSMSKANTPQDMSDIEGN
ncbi:MAG: VCBS repeat-containing protein [Desulfovibrionaceae bacterium]|nr:VCBS repeat-containing protein [Desulfovibrionaceae bacterium]